MRRARSARFRPPREAREPHDRMAVGHDKVVAQVGIEKGGICAQFHEVIEVERCQRETLARGKSARHLRKERGAVARGDAQGLVSDKEFHAAPSSSGAIGHAGSRWPEGKTWEISGFPPHGLALRNYCRILDMLAWSRGA